MHQGEHVLDVDEIPAQSTLLSFDGHKAAVDRHHRFASMSNNLIMPEGLLMLAQFTRL